MSIAPRSVRSAAPSPSPHCRSDSIDALEMITSDYDTTRAADSSSMYASTAAEPALADNDMIGLVLFSLFANEDPAKLLAPARRQLTADEVAERQLRDDVEGVAARVLAKGRYAVFEFAEDGGQENNAVDEVEEMAVKTVEKGSEEALPCHIKGEDSSKCSVQ